MGGPGRAGNEVAVHVCVVERLGGRNELATGALDFRSARGMRAAPV